MRLSETRRKNAIRKLYSDVKESGGAMDMRSLQSRLCGLCNFNCLRCQNCFIYGGWCPSETTGNCMYYQLVDLFAYEDPKPKPKFENKTLLLVDKAIQLKESKGFLTKSILQYHFRIGGQYADELMGLVELKLNKGHY